MKEHHLGKAPFEFQGIWKRVKPLSLAHTCRAFVSMLQKEEHFFWSNQRLCSSLFRPSKPSGSLSSSMCFTPSSLQAGPASYVRCDFTRTWWLQPRCRSGPRNLARIVTVQAAEDSLLPWPADRAKAGRNLCQDDRQAVGSGLNRGVHCVLYLFILSAGGRPDPPWPAV